ncbi:PhoU domain-containing protein [Nocardia callitridis]|uniref:Phosphate signaling complex protein PhoU n=1 Tax=Nocardia callitridis TaxID=648753 RepID=A0ABP9KTA6_9NOCA
MRTQFTRELNALTDDLTLMCRHVHDATARLTDALVDADLTATYEVFALDEQLQKMYGACEARTVLLLALQAPVARDLRHVVTAIQIATELSDIGTLTNRVANHVYRAHPGHIAPEPILNILAELGALAVARAADVGDAVATGHLPPVTELDTGAQEIAALRLRLRAALTDPAATQPTESAIDVVLVGDHLERCVQHTARIDRLIRFLDTGVPPTAQPADSE